MTVLLSTLRRFATTPAAPAAAAGAARTSVGRDRAFINISIRPTLARTRRGGGAASPAPTGLRRRARFGDGTWRGERSSCALQIKLLVNVPYPLTRSAAAWRKSPTPRSRSRSAAEEDGTLEDGEVRWPLLLCVWGPLVAKAHEVVPGTRGRTRDPVLENIRSRSLERTRIFPDFPRVN